MIRLKHILQELKQRDDKQNNKRDDDKQDDSALSGYMFIGDSLSSLPDGGTWNGKLDKSYNLGAKHVYLSGCTTKWMKANALPIITSNPGKFKKVVIWGGTNDAFNNDTGGTISNLTAISKAVKANGGQLYVFLGYDAAKVMINLGAGSRYCDNKCRQQGKARTIELFKQIEKGIPGAIIIPRVPGGDKSWAPADGVHISGTAHAAIASHIWPYIKP